MRTYLLLPFTADEAIEFHRLLHNFHPEPESGTNLLGRHELMRVIWERATRRTLPASATASSPAGRRLAPGQRNGCTRVGDSALGMRHSPG